MIKLEIWKYRNARGLSLRELSARCGISKSALQRMESGEISPTLDQLDRIAAALDVPLTKLFIAQRE